MGLLRNTYGIISINSLFQKNMAAFDRSIKVLQKCLGGLLRIYCIRSKFRHSKSGHNFFVYLQTKPVESAVILISVM